MGTQFWWFYDVLTVVLLFGIGYAVIAKGFNKVVFQLAAFAVAVVVGVTGANLTAPKVYEELLREKILETVRLSFSDETFNIYQRVSESYALSADAEEKNLSAEELHKKFLAVKNQETPVFEEWYAKVICDALEQRANEAERLHYISGEQTTLSARMQALPSGNLRDLLLCFEEDSNKDLVEQIEICIEPVYDANYTQLVRLSLFLVIELVILIICCIIAMMMSHVDQEMHLRRGDHLLAVPVALVEIASLLFVICVIVRLIAQLTDNEMLLFNQQTIDETMLFKHIYHVQDFLFGIRTAQ
ncbi:MAG: hypothetical protein K6F80_01825 [Oscillospiraceae bacterium]|nr:hypothetical protein [Oscillospiraceae bacterium]